MKHLYSKSFLLLFCLNLLFNATVLSQNSILVNFGSSTCSNPLNPSFSLINNPLTAFPSVLADCNVAAQLPDYFNVYIAYNPKDNKLYIADIRTITRSDIWVLDIGLPGNIACPTVIPITPTYSYSYTSNNFEFDNNGNLWSLNEYDPITGLSSIDKIDVATGAILSTSALQFPVGNFPSDVGSGDITILPNGRMFATLGNSPSKLYEILNYSASTGTATATYLQTMPTPTYGIAYLNGLLEVSGNNSVDTCYYYDYDIATNTLGERKIFQNGFSPIDNTSIAPAIGTTKQLVNAVSVNSNTVDLTYEIYVKNLGNVIINNINISDDLEAAFGVGNVSNVSTNFVPGNNAGALALNPSYNGTTITNLLDPGQNLANRTLDNTDYFFKIAIKCRVTNLIPSTTYYNSAIGTGNIGSGLSIANVSDSSNNGTPDVVDPNNNNNAGDVGENTPTPFNLDQLVPVRFINVSASFINNHVAAIKWTVATPTVNAKSFEIEFSKDGRQWGTIGNVTISSITQSSYQVEHTNIPAGNLYYRIKQIDIDGSYIFSRAVLLNNNKKGNSYVVFPNPAKNFIQLISPYGISGNSIIQLFDAAGRMLIENTMTSSTMELNTTSLSNGTYLLRIKHNEDITTQKLLIAH